MSHSKYCWIAISVETWKMVRKMFLNKLGMGYFVLGLHTTL